ncbi:MAG TPA: hypothetical protein H9867_00595 [Candidatus Corynebacterium gallistercoris]|uniref:Uncharacterized protein n=1 Tax=Candidatus Corynebacterium gallistercoris TaxID=2838530 RepID=A0A9D1UP37_9CORY|nr:hypothetical protein [Candidatus Corynebacterium gallistercoris]
MTLVTLWFVTAAQPRTVVDAEPQADRGFARKYLAQLNPAWPLTHIGDFDMTRSAAPDQHEFYIGGYPGLSVVQTIIPGLHKLSELPERYRILVSASDVYATAVADPNTVEGSMADAIVPEGALEPSTPDFSTFGGFAHWAGGTLKRSFCATRETVFEDIGLPYPFELKFWDEAEEVKGIQLPFNPAKAARIAQEDWLGFQLSPEGPEISVAAFAVDGRPEAKSSEYDGLTHPWVVSSGAVVDAAEPGYDDYAGRAPEAEPTGKEVAKNVASSLASTAANGIRGGIKGLRKLSTSIGDEVRRRARGN